MNWLQVIRDVAAIVAAGVGSVVAVIGLYTWRRQLAGQTQYELARRLLRAVYRFRDSFAVVRSPIVPLPEERVQPGEIAAADRERARMLALRGIYDQRLGHLREAWSDLEVSVREAEVLWGTDAPEVFRPLRECMGELVATVLEFFWLNDPPPYATVDRNPERVRRVERVVYGVSGSAETDEFLRKLLAAVQAAEDFVRPHLKLKWKLW